MMNSTRIFVLSFTLAAFSAPAFSAVRVALVANGGGPIASRTIGLATAQLSGTEGLELIDRQSIDSLLKEQKLSLSGLVDDQKLQIGKLLRADLFAVVETDAGDGRALGLVIFDTVSGLRLADTPIGGKPDQSAVAITDAVRAAITKDRTLGQDAKLVGFLPVRNADLPRDDDILCDTLRLLLERQLTASPQIAVLERSRLVQVNKERQLPTTQGGGNLWPSVTLVQLEISAGPNGRGLKAIAKLLDSAGRAVDTLHAGIDSDSAADLADKLRDRLIESLKAHPIDHPFDRAQEASRFALDSKILVYNSRFAAGAAAAEAAFALHPGGNRLTLATALWASAWQYLTPDNVNLTYPETEIYGRIHPSADDLDHSLVAAARALKQEQVIFKTRINAQDGDSYLNSMGGEERITFLQGFCSRINAVDNVPPEFQPRINEFRSAAMDFITRYYDGWAKTVAGNPSDLEFFDAEMVYALEVDAAISTSFAEFSATRNHLVHQWLAAFDQHWLPPKELWMDAGGRQSGLMNDILAMDSLDTGRWKDYSDESFRRSLHPIADDLNHSSNPVMRMYGIVAEALSSPDFANSNSDARTKALQALQCQLTDTLHRPGSAPNRTRRYAYIAAVDGIHMLTQNSDSDNNAIIDLLNLAAGRKDVIPEVAFDLIGDGQDEVDAASDGADPRLLRWIAVLQKSLNVTRLPDCHILDSNVDGVRQKLTAELHAIHGKYPQLVPEKLSQPWNSAKLLANLSSLPAISNLESAYVSGGNVFLLGTGTASDGGAFIEAFEIPLIGGTPIPLARMPLVPPSDSGLMTSSNVVATESQGSFDRMVQGHAVDAINFYASVDQEGVFVFPLDGSSATHIDRAHGLPSNTTQSIAAQGDYLYIASSAHDGSYLTKWNVKDKSTQIIISSLRKNKKSPLDNMAGMRIEFMADDAPRKRLLLAVADLGPGARMRWEDIRGGLWSLDTTTGKFNHLMTEANLTFGENIGFDHEFLYAANTIWVTQFDLLKNRGRYFNFKPGTMQPHAIWGMNPDPQTVKGSGWTEPDARDGERKVIDNWLWTGEPFSRISADSKTIEMLDPQLDPANPPLGSIWIIEPAGTNRVVVGDSNQIYALSIKAKQ